MTIIKQSLALLALAVGLSSGGCSLQDFDKFEEPDFPDGSDGTFPVNVHATGDGTGTIRADIPAGFECGHICGENYPWGTTVVYTASAWDGSVFIGWSGPCEGTGDCVVRVTEPVTLEAEFQPESP